jgi:hypothetical protein
MKPKPAAGKKQKRVTKGKHPNPIIFRLSAEQYACLLEQAGETGPNEWAKETVLKALEQEGDADDIVERLATVEALLSTLRRELRLSVHGLLIASSEGKKLTPEQVDKWVESTLGDS